MRSTPMAAANRPPCRMFPGRADGAEGGAWRCSGEDRMKRDLSGDHGTACFRQGQPKLTPLSLFTEVYFTTRGSGRGGLRILSLRQSTAKSLHKESLMVLRESSCRRPQSKGDVEKERKPC